MLWAWFGFILLVLAFLALDLGVFHRHAHVVSVREALLWSAIWASLGLSFGAFVYFGYERHWFGLGLLSLADAQFAESAPVGAPPAVFVDKWAVSPENPYGLLDGRTALVKYVTGYLVEKSLAVDNIFVIALIFSYLSVPPLYQHRVLFWGILGALVMRGALIVLGSELIHQYHGVIYLFGGFLVLTGIKMLLISEQGDPTQSWIVRLARRLWPLTDNYHGERFFVRTGTPAAHAPSVPGGEVQPDAAVDRLETARPGALMMTPLFLALLLVEFTDLIFALDSIPAIFAITTDPFLVFTSNAFAILGLRSLYFALAGLLDQFRYLKIALAVLLMVVGVKMMIHPWLKERLGENVHFYLLGVTAAILTTGVLASIVSERLWPRRAA